MKLTPDETKRKRGQGGAETTPPLLTSDKPLPLHCGRQPQTEHLFVRPPHLDLIYFHYSTVYTFIYQITCHFYDSVLAPHRKNKDTHQYENKVVKY